jgi:hypothetical protein
MVMDDSLCGCKYVVGGDGWAEPIVIKEFHPKEELRRC